MISVDQIDSGATLYPRQIWSVVLTVALLHALFVLIARHGLPTFDRKKISEITIELSSASPRGQGGDAAATVAKPFVRPPTQVKAPAQDDNALRRSLGKSATAAQGVSDPTVAAGSDSAPTIDASYKAAYLNNPKPPYPSAAFKMRIEGTVVIKVLVKPDGSCGEVLLGRSSGNDLLDRSALETVALWKFTPAKSHGKEVSQWVSIPIAFSIKRR